MEGLLWLLGFGLLFYFMMRFGCGAHMVHGHAGHGQHGGRHDGGVSTESAQGVDPVCGMAVPAGQGYSKAYAGREYRFCSRACLDKFEARPAEYAAH